MFLEERKGVNKVVYVYTSFTFVVSLVILQFYGKNR